MLQKNFTLYVNKYSIAHFVFLYIKKKEDLYRFYFSNYDVK